MTLLRLYIRLSRPDLSLYKGHISVYLVLFGTTIVMNKVSKGINGLVQSREYEVSREERQYKGRQN